MSSSADVIQAEAIQVRPARWSWITLACFFAVVTVALAFVVVNGESLAGRLGAQDGRVSVTSAPGGGTTIEGRLPLAVEARAVM